MTKLVITLELTGSLKRLAELTTVLLNAVRFFCHPDVRWSMTAGGKQIK